MAKRKPKRLKAYNYDTFGKARTRGYTYTEWINSKRAKNRWENLPQLKKEFILTSLEVGREKKKYKVSSKDLKPLFESDEIVTAYKIVSTSHYDFRSKKVSSKFEYNLDGYFQFEPKIETFEKMAKNSLIKAFNSGTQKRYLKNSVFSELVDKQIMGYKVEVVKVKKYEVQNNLNAVLEITNNGKKWTGRN